MVCTLPSPMYTHTHMGWLAEAEVFMHKCLKLTGLVCLVVPQVHEQEPETGSHSPTKMATKLTPLAKLQKLLLSTARSLDIVRWYL